jgi:long-chain acyl-CoA synthetase
MNTCTFLAKAARQRGDEAAIVRGDEVIGYTTFYRRALAIGGNLLARGVKRGDRVAFALANSPRILETLYGCFAAGVVVVPVNSRLHAREMAYIVQNSGARVFIYGPEFAAGIESNAEAFPSAMERICTGSTTGCSSYDELLEDSAQLGEPVHVDPAEPAWLFYTSGTTGRPKGATWTHRTISCVVMNYLADVHNIQSGEMVLHAAPMSHGSGIVALPAVARGAINAIYEGTTFDPKTLFQQIERLRVTHIAFLAPTMIVKMLEQHVPGEYDLSTLRAICYGGGPIYVEHLKRAIAAFGPIFAQIYGQGEAPMTITGLSAAEHDRLIASGDERIGSAGTIRTDVEARVVDADDRELPPGEPGEVVARGDVVMAGYWNNPAATAETLRNGWLHTGDIGAFDERGYLFLLDRAKDVIVSGGNNIYPREVEEAIVSHPAVATALVFGVPDDYWGEAVHALVVLERGSTATTEDILRHCDRGLASYKKPKSVEFVPELAISGYGKVQRREIRDRYWQGHDRRIAGGSTRHNEPVSP